MSVTNTQPPQIDSPTHDKSDVVANMRYLYPLLLLCSSFLVLAGVVNQSWSVVEIEKHQNWPFLDASVSFEVPCPVPENLKFNITSLLHLVQTPACFILSTNHKFHAKYVSNFAQTLQQVMIRQVLLALPSYAGPCTTPMAIVKADPSPLWISSDGMPR